MVSAKMQKTIVVRIERLTRHPQYERVMRKAKKFKVHDETSQARAGDLVRIEETRPLSKEKRWRLLEILRRAPDTIEGDALTDQAFTEKALTGHASPKLP